MATENNVGADFSLPAAADLSAKQYFLVKIDTSGKAALCAAATDPCVGVLQNDPKSAHAASIRPVGISKVVYGGTVTAGDLLTSDGSGNAVKAGSGNYVIGVARVSGSAADVGSMLLINAGRTS